MALTGCLKQESKTIIRFVCVYAVFHLSITTNSNLWSKCLIFPIRYRSVSCVAVGLCYSFVQCSLHIQSSIWIIRNACECEAISKSLFFVISSERHPTTAADKQRYKLVYLSMRCGGYFLSLTGILLLPCCVQNVGSFVHSQCLSWELQLSFSTSSPI